MHWPVGINLEQPTTEQPRNSAAVHRINLGRPPEELPPVLHQCAGSIAGSLSPGIHVQLADRHRLVVEQEVGCSTGQNQPNRARFRSNGWRECERSRQP